MNYRLGDKVEFHYPTETDPTIKGTIFSISNQDMVGNVYGIECSDSYGSWTTYLFEYNLAKLIVHHTVNQCECGADKLNHPGHSWFCPKWKDSKCHDPLT